MSNAKFLRPKHYNASDLSAKQVAQLCKEARIAQPSMEDLSNHLVRLAYAMRASAMIKRPPVLTAGEVNELQNLSTEATTKLCADLKSKKPESVTVDLKKRAAGDDE